MWGTGALLGSSSMPSPCDCMGGMRTCSTSTGNTGRYEYSTLKHLQLWKRLEGLVQRPSRIEIDLHGVAVAISTPPTARSASSWQSLKLSAPLWDWRGWAQHTPKPKAAPMGAQGTSCCPLLGCTKEMGSSTWKSSLEPMENPNAPITKLRQRPCARARLPCLACGSTAWIMAAFPVPAFLLLTTLASAPHYISHCCC